MNEILKKIIYWFLMLMMICSLAYTVRKYNTMSEQYHTNVKAMTDTITVNKNKIGELVASKHAYLMTIDELKRTNLDLYNKIDELDIKNSKLEHALYTKGEANYGKHDTIYIVKEDTINKGFNHHFNFDNKWRELSGNIEYKDDKLGMNIDRDIMYFDYTIGVDKNNEIFIKSTNPYIKYNELTGVTVPKPKTYRWSVGPTFGAGYGFINNKFDIFLGISINYALFRF